MSNKSMFFKQTDKLNLLLIGFGIVGIFLAILYLVKTIDTQNNSSDYSSRTIFMLKFSLPAIVLGIIYRSLENQKYKIIRSLKWVGIFIFLSSLTMLLISSVVAFELYNNSSSSGKSRYEINGTMLRIVVPAMLGWQLGLTIHVVNWIIALLSGKHR